MSVCKIRRNTQSWPDSSYARRMIGGEPAILRPFAFLVWTSLVWLHAIFDLRYALRVLKPAAFCEDLAALFSAIILYIYFTVDSNKAFPFIHRISNSYMVIAVLSTKHYRGRSVTFDPRFAFIFWLYYFTAPCLLLLYWSTVRLTDSTLPHGHRNHLFF